jgi:hypothetical protein
MQQKQQEKGGTGEPNYRLFAMEPTSLVNSVALAH